MLWDPSNILVVNSLKVVINFMEGLLGIVQV